LRQELIKETVAGFISESYQCIHELVKYLGESAKTPRQELFFFKDGRRKNVEYSNRFFLRASTEYSNPQLTLEDLQGILVARILEACANHALETNEKISEKSIEVIAKRVTEPPKGVVVPFLLITDDVEADRYSINPLRESIVATGQSAFPAHSIRTDGLKIDETFLRKYKDILVSADEASRIQYYVENEERYVDAVDSMKYDQLEKLSDLLGIQLVMPALRMPLETLSSERSDGPMHHLIRQAHSSYETLTLLYQLMGRSITKRKTLLLVVPHSSKGFGSKRAASGRLVFENETLKSIKVHYRPTLLYPNDIDSSDVSIAKACDNLSVEAKDILEYSFIKTPASPQFALYSVLSPEAAAIWHGVGLQQGGEVVRSYYSMHSAQCKHLIFQDIPKPYSGIPLQLDLIAGKMLRHPTHGNVDASVGTVNLPEMLKKATSVRVLQANELLRKADSWS
jgi:hypothetical protein